MKNLITTKPVSFRELLGNGKTCKTGKCYMENKLLSHIEAC